MQSYFLILHIWIRCCNNYLSMLDHFKIIIFIFICVAANGKMSSWASHYGFVCFIHSSKDWHWGGFHLLSIVCENLNSAKIYMCLPFHCKDFTQLCIYTPSGEVAGLWFSYICFWGTSVLFSAVAVLINIPTNSTQQYPFLHSFNNIFLSFEVMLDCSFD